MNELVPNQQNLIIYNTLDGKVSVTMMTRNGNVWMNQKQMAELFATSKQNVGQHIANILKENELVLDSVVKNFFITAADGKHYNVAFYSLDMALPMPNLPPRYTNQKPLHSRKDSPTYYIMRDETKAKPLHPDSLCLATRWRL